MACPPGGPHSGYFVCTLHTLHIHTSRPNGHGPPNCGTRFPGDLPAHLMVQLFMSSASCCSTLAGVRWATSRAVGTSRGAVERRSSPWRPRRARRSARSLPEELLFTTTPRPLYSYVPYHSSRRDAVGPWSFGVAQRSVHVVAGGARARADRWEPVQRPAPPTGSPPNTQSVPVSWQFQLVQR